MLWVATSGRQYRHAACTYKAWLVAKSFRQKPAVDYNEDAIAMAVLVWQDGRTFGLLQVPQLDGAVLAAARNDLLVVVKADAVNGRLVALQALHNKQQRAV